MSVEELPRFDPVEEISGGDAFRNVRTNQYGSWPSRQGEFNRIEPVALPHFQVPFKIHRGMSIFTIGSCFARNIESKLAELGFAIPAMKITQHGAASPSVLNNYSTPSIYNEIRWALDPTADFDAAHHLYPVHNKVADLHLAGRWARPVSLELAQERREQVKVIYGNLAEAHVIIMTLGLLESWYDNDEHIYLNSAPLPNLIEYNENKFSLRVLRHAEIMYYMTKTLDLIKKYCNSEIRVILTISPVPLQRTFRKDVDVSVANTYSKCTLRAVAEECTADYNFVTYFPSYESVTLSRRDIAWEDDQVHVTKDVVDVNVSRMVAAFMAEDAQASSDLSIVRQQARNLFIDGDFVGSIDASGMVLAAMPTDKFALEYLIRSTEKLHGSAAALALLESHGDLSADREISTLRGRLLMNERRYHDAKMLGKELVAANASDVQAHILLGDALLHQKEYAESIKVYEQLLILKNRIGLPYYKLANAHFCNGDTSVALKYIDIAISINPDHATYRKLRDKMAK